MEEDVLRVGRGDLQTVEEKAGAFGIDAVGGKSVEGLDERELDGGAVLDGRELERWVVKCGPVGPLRMTVAG